jgi:nucleoside-diphosphate-sugar epimerase
MSSKGLVLVTGANGFIGARTVEAFLNAGFSVRGAVRSSSSGDGLLAALPEAAAQGLLEIAEVPDITAAGAFDEAIKGVTAVAHLATPVSFYFTDPDYVIRTAVEGARSILESAAKEAGLKHFVFMSSVVAVLSETKPQGHVFTEADWNETAPGTVAELGAKTPGRTIYAASKTLAEREFWKFKEERKPSFTMAAVNPV